jgi:hypothetical protein
MQIVQRTPRQLVDKYYSNQSLKFLPGFDCFCRLAGGSDRPNAFTSWKLRATPKLATGVFARLSRTKKACRDQLITFG